MTDEERQIKLARAIECLADGLLSEDKSRRKVFLAQARDNARAAQRQEPFNPAYHPNLGGR